MIKYGVDESLIKEGSAKEEKDLKKEEALKAKKRWEQKQKARPPRPIS
jgi:hypothetical protein